jgi:DNA-directed RNA polymerase subunit M/transcription elongation factor TFIIS
MHNSTIINCEKCKSNQLGVVIHQTYTVGVEFIQHIQCITCKHTHIFKLDLTKKEG